MKNLSAFWAAAAGVAVGIVLFAVLGAGTIEDSGIFQSLKLGGRTNLVSDDNVDLTYNGAHYQRSVPILNNLTNGIGTNLTSLLAAAVQAGQTNPTLASLGGVANNNGIATNLNAVGLSVSGSDASFFTNGVQSAAAISGPAIVATNSITSGQSGYTGYSVSSLPAGVAVGYQTYCTDCITPWGTGDRVEWDGSVWRTLRIRIPATADMLTYLWFCETNALTIGTPTTTAIIQVEGNTGTQPFLPRVFSNINGGSSGFSTVSDVFGPINSFASVAATNSGGYAYSILMTAPVSGNTYACGGRYWLSITNLSTDIYWCIPVGFSLNISSYPTSGAYFLYDPYNITAHGQSYTNDWICVSVKSSSYTFADSGLVPKFGANTLTGTDRLMVVLTTTSATFLTNGVTCAVITTNIPTSATFLNKTEFQKYSGSSTPNLWEASPFFHIRRASARQY